MHDIIVDLWTGASRAACTNWSVTHRGWSLDVNASLYADELLEVLSEFQVLLQDRSSHHELC